MTPCKVFEEIAFTILMNLKQLLTLECSQTAQDSKALKRIEVAIPARIRPVIKML